MTNAEKTGKQLIRELEEMRQRIADLEGSESEHKLTQQALRESEEKFHKIFEHSNDAIILVDPERDEILDANTTACRMLGYSRQELLKLGMSAIHPDETPRLLAFAQSVIDLGRGWTDQLCCQTKAGKILPAEISASVVEIGGRMSMIALVRDTTERGQAEERIRQEAARAAALARAAARLNAQLTLDAVLQTVCEEAAHSLDVTAVSILLHDEDAAVLRVAATLGLPPEFRKRYLPIPRGLYDQYARKNGPVTAVPDMQAMSNLPNAALHARCNIRSAGIASLIREGRLMGALSVFTIGNQHAFGEEDLALLKGLAAQAAQAIENARLNEQAQQLAVVEERSRLARDLHDSVAQSLYGMTLNAEAGARMLAAGHAGRAAAQLRKISRSAEEALREMRLLIFELRHPVLEAEGLAAALQARLEAVEERIGLKPSFVAEQDVLLAPAVEEGLYRIAQEALNNVINHAQAQNIMVRLFHDAPKVILEIADDGVGFDLEKARARGGLGIGGMKERTDRMGGRLIIESRRRKGTCVRVEVDSGGG